MEVINKKSKIYRLSAITIIGTVFTLLAFIVAILSFVIQVSKKKFEISAQVITSDELTFFAPEADLKARYTWGGEEVAHLWKLRIRFINSGDKTIVGKGPLQNILNDGISFIFPDKSRILRIDKEYENFQNEVIQTKLNKFQIRFSQWRSSEYTIINFYITSEEALEKSLFLTVPSRDIIDGDVLIQNFIEKKPSERLFLLKYLLGRFSSVAKTIGFFTVSLILLAFLLVIFIGWAEYIKLIRWKTNYTLDFNKYLDTLAPPLSIEYKELYIQKPYKLPESLWKNFKYQPLVKEPTFKTKTEGIAFTITFIILFLGGVSLILALIPA
jgi:hypothetical protein